MGVLTSLGEHLICLPYHDGDLGPLVEDTFRVARRGVVPERSVDTGDPIGCVLSDLPVVSLRALLRHAGAEEDGQGSVGDVQRHHSVVSVGQMTALGVAA